ncbi:hypothetical protein [Haliangium sp.]|uniref:hypothetical protein n=1 Tax=Haliangium sp. TaxID=2663208 RepID=UPI003D12E8D5
MKRDKRPPTRLTEFSCDAYPVAESLTGDRWAREVLVVRHTELQQEELIVGSGLTGGQGLI